MAVRRDSRLYTVQDESWYSGKVMKEQVYQLLKEEEEQGAFLVRDDPEEPDSFILSVWTGGQVVDYPVGMGWEGECEVNGRDFVTLEAAIEYYQLVPLNGTRLAKQGSTAGHSPDCGGNSVFPGDVSEDGRESVGPSCSSRDIGPPIMLVWDRVESGLPDYIKSDITLFEDETETDFSDISSFVVEVDIEPSEVPGLETRQDAGAIGNGTLEPIGNDDDYEVIENRNADPLSEYSGEITVVVDIEPCGNANKMSDQNDDGSQGSDASVKLNQNSGDIKPISLSSSIVSAVNPFESGENRDSSNPRPRKIPFSLSLATSLDQGEPQLPVVTYSTFKPSTPISEAPPLLPLSPTPSIASSLLDIYPTRRSFVERRSSSVAVEGSPSLAVDRDDSTDEYSSSCSSEGSVFSDTEEDSTHGSLVTPTDDVAGSKDTYSPNCSEVTLTPSSNLASQVAVTEEPPARCSSSEKEPKWSNYARRCLSGPHPGSLSSPSILDRDGRSLPPDPPPRGRDTFCSSDNLDCGSGGDAGVGVGGRRERSDDSLRLSPFAAHPKPCGPRPVPCVFPEYRSHPNGLDAPPKANFLSDNHTIRHSFVFSNPSSPVRSGSTRTLPNAAPFRHPNPAQRRPTNAHVESTPSKPPKRPSRRLSLVALTSFFQTAFKRRSFPNARSNGVASVASLPTKPPSPPKKVHALSRKESAKQLSLEIQSQYSNITKRKWESDSMVVLPRQPS